MRTDCTWYRLRTLYCSDMWGAKLFSSVSASHASQDSTTNLTSSAMDRTCESGFYQNEGLVLQSVGCGTAKLNKTVAVAPVRLLSSQTNVDKTSSTQLRSSWLDESLREKPLITPWRGKPVRRKELKGQKRFPISGVDLRVRQSPAVSSHNWKPSLLS